MNTVSTMINTAQLDYVLRIADSSLILGHRLSEWCGHGPVIEEDIALTNVALDLIGKARLLYAHAGSVEGDGRHEDDFAFRRTASEFRNVTLVELPNDDYGCTTLRNFLFTSFQRELWGALQTSGDVQLAEIAAKSAKETRYHVQHAADWTVRLGDGTDASHARMQRALDTLWPYTAEFFSTSAIDDRARDAAIGPVWSTLETAWRRAVLPVLDVATLKVPERIPSKPHGKDGHHSEHLERLLAEMQYLQRTYPNCNW